MEHLQVIAYLLSLLVGIGAVVLTFQAASSGRYPELRPYSWFLISFNLLVLISLAIVYCCTNLLSGYEEFLSSGIIHIVGPIVRITFFGMAYALFRASLVLRGKVLSSAGRRRLNAGTAAFIIVVVIATSILQMNADRGPSMWTNLGLSFSTYLFLIMLMVNLYRFGRRQEEEAERRMITSFGLFYLVAFCSIIVLALLPMEVGIVPAAIVLILFNLFPILWLRRHFPSPEAEAVPVLEDPVLFETFCTQHNISNREREIAELILRGKSNKEIEDQLFISLNTVKNHIYRLFQKLGVNSRSQFIHMLLQEQRSRFRGA